MPRAGRRSWRSAARSSGEPESPRNLYPALPALQLWVSREHRESHGPSPVPTERRAAASAHPPLPDLRRAVARRLPPLLLAALRQQGSPELAARSEEHTSEFQSLMRNSSAVFCLKQKKQYNTYKDIRNKRIII